MLSATKQAITLKLTYNGRSFFVTLTLTLQTFILLVQLVFPHFCKCVKLIRDWFGALNLHYYYIYIHYVCFGMCVVSIMQVCRWLFYKLGWIRFIQVIKVVWVHTHTHTNNIHTQNIHTTQHTHTTHTVRMASAVENWQFSEITKSRYR